MLKYPESAPALVQVRFGLVFLFVFGMLFT
jgi:hypothetical protein